MLTVHGRTKEQNKHLTGNCNWDAIKFIKENANLPIIANGGVENFKDIQKLFDYTKCDAIMSAEKLLEIPFLFAGEENQFDIDDVALEYVNISKEDENDISIVRSHLHKFLYGACKVNIK